MESVGAEGARRISPPPKPPVLAHPTHPAPRTSIGTDVRFNGAGP